MAYWAKLGQDIDGESANDYSGQAVSLSADGTRVAIGAVNNAGSGPDAGQTRIYQYDNETWSQLGQDINGEAAGDYSGGSVSLNADGTRVAIGAIYNDESGPDSGQTRIYQYYNESWYQLGQDINGESAGDYSGYAVSLSADGTRVAIGSPRNSNAGHWAGQTRIYQYDNETWTQLGQDINGESANNYSGCSVSLSADGTRVAIGAIYNSDSGLYAGQTRIYEYNSGSWTQLGQDINGEAAGDLSGFSVSLSADKTRVAIGAPHNDVSGPDSGQTRIYQYANGTWTKLGQDINGKFNYDECGNSVSLSADGNKVAIGSRYNSDSGLYAGQTRIYQYDNEKWAQLGQDINGEAAGDYSGFSVSLSADGTRVAIGDSNNSDSGQYAGQTRVYEYITPTPPIGNICFVAGTPILTDQGNVPIEHINPDYHTIMNKPIIGITQSVYASDKYIVSFEKGCLGNNIPSQKTLVSMNHKIFYDGAMIRAAEFVGKFNNVKHVKYNGEILYNVLMNKRDKILVNNLICETLDPQNEIAQLYMICKRLNKAQQKYVIERYNSEYRKKYNIIK